MTHPQVANFDVISGTVSSIRTRTASASVKVKTNMVNEALVIGSLNRNDIARGVNCALANCTASNSVDDKNMMKVSIAAPRVPMTSLAVSGERDDRQPILVSIELISQVITIPATT